MTFTHTQTCRTPFGTLSDTGKVFTGAADVSVDEVTPIGLTSDIPITVSFPQSGFQCMAILTNLQNILINNVGGGAFGESIRPGVMTLVTAVSADTVGVEYDNGAPASAEGTLKIRVLYDPTP